MEFTELDFYPPTGPEGQEFIVQGKHVKFINAEWVDQTPVKPEPAKPPVTK